LGQIACADKSNEITAIPLLLDSLNIKGAIITLDAMGTQTAIAKKIIENGGDYILAVKGNQSKLEEEVHITCEQKPPLFDTCEIEKGHGRIETRRCEVFGVDLILDEIKNNWEKLNTVIKITSTREYSDKIETCERFYISSIIANKEFNTNIRSHWGV
jgi:predicted transposase YbfD/YdcC